MYKIMDTFEAPQAGCEVIQFDDWYELDEYLDEHPDVADRVETLYAVIIED